MTAPPPLEHLNERPFSFFPPILGVEHNEWTYVRSTWSEMLVANTKSGAEVWIPRQYLGELSRVDEPVMIVGLRKELQYKAGSVWPYERRVVQMPRGLAEPPPANPEEVAASLKEPPGRRGAQGPETRIGLLIGAAIAIGLLATFVVVSVLREGPLRPKVVFTTKDQSFLELTRDDGYFEVVRKLGQPKDDRWREGGGELKFRVLAYPERGYSALLMGTERESARYVGSVDSNWHVVHAVDSPRGGNTLPLLRNLKPF
ncbi:MAG: hypothetical protein SFV54_28950 [Bryobacteraceae bacterium]|nr:hypothetical protein [Bryobacteraceae bacterium]